MKDSNGRRHRLEWLLALAMLLPTLVGAQAPAPPPAGGNLFVLDPAGTPLGEIPANIKQLKGMLEVVMKDGVPMLKASAVSEFLITLPRALPRDFTLEFDLVPKACCNPQDLSFEGTPTINQGGGSAHVMWDSDGYLAVVGGGDFYEAPMPEELRTTLPGVLTSVVAVIEGPSVRLYTNGRRHYTLDRTFARGRVLRVLLGGQDDNAKAVYLAGMRIVAGAAPPTLIAANPTPPPGQAAPATGQPGTPSPSQPTGAPSVGAVPAQTPPVGTSATTAPTTVMGTAAAPAAPVATVAPPAPLPPNAGRYRVTITGLAATKGTVDDPRDYDGVGDEVYAASVVVLWNRKDQTVLDRQVVRSREYGDVGNGQRGTRIQAGSATATGGIWGGNGNDFIPREFDPRSTVLPPPESDRFPLRLWEGVLTDGVEGLLVVPSLWESDENPFGFDNYVTNWKTSPITLLSSPTVVNQLIVAQIAPAMVPQNTTYQVANALATLFTGGLVGSFGMTAALLTANLDRPIGLGMGGNITDYQDRLVVITREKLTSLAPGAGMTFAIPLAEPVTGALGGIYTLYLRVDRTQ